MMINEPNIIIMKGQSKFQIDFSRIIAMPMRTMMNPKIKPATEPA